MEVYVASFAREYFGDGGGVVGVVIMELIVFYIFGGLAVATALAVVAFKNPISSAFSLIVCFFAIAALYAMLNAHFLAVIQILVYAGAIMVLFIFVIMLLNLRGEELEERGSSVFFKTITGLLLAGLTGGFFFIFRQMQFGFKPVNNAFGTVKMVGRLLFTEYWFPFEYTSVLLLVAIIGGVVLAKREL
jgi:NADH-quinone oxidoreductase subunit J